jgi:hypothetical protein
MDFFIIVLDEQKIKEKLDFIGVVKATEKKIGSGFRYVIQCYGSADSDPCQNVPDTEHRLEG